MKVTCNNYDIKNGVLIVSQAVEKTSEPFTSMIYIEAISNEEFHGLKLRSDNKVSSVVALVPGLVEEISDSVVVPANLLNGMLSGVKANQEVVFEITDKKNQSLKISSKGITEYDDVECRLNTVSGNLFFQEQTPILGYSIEITAQNLKDGINQVLFAKGEDEEWPILSGVNAIFTKETATFGATERHVMALKKLDTENCLERGQLNATIPGKQIDKLSRALPSSDSELVEVGLSTNGSFMIFRWLGGKRVFSINLLEGKYPDLYSYVRKNWSTRITLDTAIFKKAIGEASLYAKEGGKNAVRLTFTRSTVIGADSDGSVLLEARADEQGILKRKIPAIKIEGNNNRIACQVTLMDKALSSIKSDQITIEMSDEGQPLYIRPVPKDGVHKVVLMVLPMYFTDEEPGETKIEENQENQKKLSKQPKKAA